MPLIPGTMAPSLITAARTREMAERVVHPAPNRVDRDLQDRQRDRRFLTSVPRTDSDRSVRASRGLICGGQATCRLAA